MNEDVVPDEPDHQGGPVPCKTDRTVNWRRFNETIVLVNERSGHLSADELQAIVAEAVTASRRAT